MRLKLLAGLGLALPWVALGLFYARPELDVNVQAPLVLFYVLTFTAFVAAVISFFAVSAVGREVRLRPMLLALAFGWMATLIMIYGAVTPGAMLQQGHPAATWASWLTLLGGGLLFLLAALVPEKRDIRFFQLALAAGGLALLAFLGLALAAPELLAAISGEPFKLVVYWATLGIWGLALIGHAWRGWRAPDALGGLFVVNSLWGLTAAVSLFAFPVGQLSWWLHHVVLLLAWLATMGMLWRNDEQVRVFQLTRYYAVASLIITAGLALISGEAYSRIVFGNLVSEMVTGSTSINRGLAANIATYLNLQQPEQIQALTITPELETWMTGQMTNFDVLESGALYSLQGMRVYPSETRAPSLPAIVGVSDIGFLAATQGGTDYRLLAPGSGATFDDAADHYYALLYTPLLNNAGDALGVLITLRDIPDLAEAEIRSRLLGLSLAAVSLGALFLALLSIVRRADRLISERTGELERAYADLVAAESQRNDLTHMIVHDLRNPLTAIAANLELMVRGIGHEVVGGEAHPQKAVALQAAMTTRLVGRALGASQRMMGMIDDLLHINKFEAGEFQLNLEPLPLAELMHEKVDLLRAQAEREGKALNVAAAPDLPLTLADGMLIGRVLENLLSNALKFTPVGGTIDLNAEKRGDKILVWVRDDGEGVPPEDRARIFEKHYQVRNDDGQPRRTGAGLGLTFCRLAVEAHGGKIGVEGPPDGGSVFFFTLPITAQLTAPKTVRTPVRQRQPE
ncbi:MAG: HAMP domain-containing histidine kinase [Anaerolineales bacterium]|nr:HAMP domain-containing histidine kinase [Anaerolineales bacterium]